MTGRDPIGDDPDSRIGASSSPSNGNRKKHRFTNGNRAGSAGNPQLIRHGIDAFGDRADDVVLLNGRQLRKNGQTHHFA